MRRKAVAFTMSNRVSIADIANALGLSRNTVSKALNGSAGITNETRQRVLDQAVRMNYKMMGSHVTRLQPTEPSTILLICKDHQLISPFFGPLNLQLQPSCQSPGRTSPCSICPPRKSGVV